MVAGSRSAGALWCHAVRFSPKAVCDDMGVAGLSLWSQDSLLSIASRGSVLSIGSVGSVLSVGSVGSALSCASVGSVLSGLSAGSALSLGSALSVRSRWSMLGAGGDHAVVARTRPSVVALIVVAGGTALAAGLVAARVRG
jgi:hypothetical protein